MARKRKVSVKTMGRMSLDELAALPGMYDIKMYDVKKHGLFKAQNHPERLVTGNPETGLAWLERQEALGLLTEADLKEEQERMLILIRAAKKGSEGDGSYFGHKVHKTSGNGQRPFPNKTYSAKDSRPISSGGYAPVRVRMGRDFGPSA